MAAESSAKLAFNSEFMWGEKLLEIGSLTSYKSMRYEGVWYSVGDYAFLRSDPGIIDHIGKLMSLLEDKGQRKIRVRWFLRAEEMPLIFSVKDPPKTDPKEIFIAMGNKKGVENESPVDVILRKAIVICTAIHPDNPQPSCFPNSIHHIFNKAYDTEKMKLLAIQKINIAKKPVVKSFFNKQEWIQALNEEPTSEAVESTGEEYLNKQARIFKSSSRLVGNHIWQVESHDPPSTVPSTQSAI